MTQHTDYLAGESDPRAHHPWPALWSLVLGFFMILVDSTIVSIATPDIMRELDADITSAVWVTSAYLLAYAAPLLVTGRLGDRFGPKPVFLVGLVVFTLASLWCGLSSSIEMLIVARVFQGLGGALLTPQTMAVITRLFPPSSRGAAMGLWGAVAGVATLVGPLAGGLLVDAAGWSWIFFVNVPVGIVAFILVVRFVPTLQRQSRTFDWLGVVLSAAAVFAIVFAIQEGADYDWGDMPLTIGDWTFSVHLMVVLVVGLVLLALFLLWQWRGPKDPLVPFRIFTRNFSLANVTMTGVGFIVTAMSLPLFLYLQAARGLTPTQSALLAVPMAICSGVLAPFIGRWVQARDARLVVVPGLTAVGAALLWYSAWMTPDVEPLWLLVPSALLGLGLACVFGPSSITATRDLPRDAAGAGSSVFNTTRQIGAVIGAASIGAMMNARIAAEVGGTVNTQQFSGGSGALPPEVVAPLSAALAQSMLLLVGVCAVSIVATLFWSRPSHATPPAASAATPTSPAAARRGTSKER